MIAAWCGLTAGLLEVGMFVVRKWFFDVNQLLWTTRHFMWLIPLVNLAIFLALGLILAVMVGLWRGRGEWWAERILGTATLLPAFWVAFPRIYGLAGFLLAAGCAVRIVPVLKRHAGAFGRVVRVSFPILAGIPPALAAMSWTQDHFKQTREAAGPLPVSTTPNVLLIVLDTVGAQHLSLHGYARRTSPTLEELAARGIRFDQAVATASWTLPSHASMLTGRWPHELSTAWNTPLDCAFPTLGEFLGKHGYATAGFIANTWYCAADSGLGRGFTEYHDYVFPRLTAFGKSALINRPMTGLKAANDIIEDWLGIEVFRPAMDELWRLFLGSRKEAADVHREFVQWLDERRGSERPFFAFLNFYDAHYPYELPALSLHRFRSRARADRTAKMMRDWVSLMNRAPTPEQVELGRDAYDDGVANLDERLGMLLDDLGRRSILDRTWVIITADHGESFGEQPGVFWHGTSLYQAQIHVPLLVLPPAGGPAPRSIADAVSLRDLPATIVQVLGLATGDKAPFPGESLARFWTHPPESERHALKPPTSQALSEVVPLDSFGADPTQWTHSPKWPLACLTEAGWTYIRRERQEKEELYRIEDDPRQQHDLAGDPALKPTLDRMRSGLDRLTGGPLTSRRVNP